MSKKLKKSELWSRMSAWGREFKSKELSIVKALKAAIALVVQLRPFVVKDSNPNSREGFDVFQKETGYTGGFRQWNATLWPLAANREAMAAVKEQGGNPSKYQTFLSIVDARFVSLGISRVQELVGKAKTIAHDDSPVVFDPATSKGKKFWSAIENARQADWLPALGGKVEKDAPENVKAIAKEISKAVAAVKKAKRGNTSTDESEFNRRRKSFSAAQRQAATALTKMEGVLETLAEEPRAEGLSADALQSVRELKEVLAAFDLSTMKWNADKVAVRAKKGKKGKKGKKSKAAA